MTYEELVEITSNTLLFVLAFILLGVAFYADGELATVITAWLSGWLIRSALRRIG